MTRYKRSSLCSECSLDGKQVVYGTCPEGPSNGILLLGEAPGAAEEAEGTPFTGPSGRLLNWALKCSGISRHQCWITNVILCRPPANDIGGFEGESAKKACSMGLKEELRSAKQAGCRVIVALGATALKALEVYGSQSSLRGSVIDGTGPAAGMFIIPTYHPAYLYRNNWTRAAGGSASHTAVWLSDLEKAREVARPGWKRPAERFITHPTLRDLEALWERVQKEPDLILGVDIETTSLDPRYGDIVVVGFATSEEDAICIPLLKAGPRGKDNRRHGIPYWPNGSHGHARDLLQKILRTAKQSYQNGFFDIPYLRHHGFDVPDEAFTYDSMLLHSIVSPETEHNLGFITSIYGKTPYWKDEFKNRPGSIFDMDEIRMREYNCRDCVVLKQIITTMLAHMKDLKLERVWYEEVKPMIRPIMIMKEKGVLFDTSRMGTFRERLTKKLRTQEDELRTLGSLPKEFNLSSDDEVRYFLFGTLPNKAVQLTSWVFEGTEPCKPTKKDPDRTSKETVKNVYGVVDEKAARRTLPREFTVTKVSRVPTLELKKKGSSIYDSLLALRTVIEETSPIYLVPGYQGPHTKGGKQSTDKDGLLSFRIAAQNRIDYLEALSKPREDEIERCTSLLVWLEKYAEYTAAEKLLTSFTRYRPSDDKRIHPNWQIHGTSTGRLSCIAKGTLVPTERGLVVIEGIVSGDRVITHTGVISEVERVIPQGFQKVIQLTLNNFQSIICTSDHKFYSPSGWVEAADAKELYFVSNERCLERLEAGREGAVPISRGHTETCCQGYCQGTWFNRAQCSCNHSGEGLEGSSDSRTSSALIEGQEWGQLSDERKDRKSTSQLEGNLFRQQGPLYRKGRRQEILSTPDNNGESFEATSKGSAFRTNCPSSGRGSLQQQPGQSCSLHQCRTSILAPEVASVKVLSDVGEMEVFDLTVRGDHSYIAGGFLAKNCTAPNLMQLPSGKVNKEDKEIRRFFYAPEGWSMVSADFENAEVALLGYDVNDPIIIDAYESGKNIHDSNTKILFGLEPSDPLWSEGRKGAKVFQFGGLSYGGGDREIHRKIVQAAPRLNLTFSAYVEAKQRWLKAHPWYVTWKESVTAEVLEKRIIYNEFGRARIFLDNDRDIVKEAMNFRIQSAGASILNRAIARIQARIDTHTPRLKGYPIMQVHDQLVYECPDEEIETFSAFIQEEMTRPFMYKGTFRSLRIELTTGKTFGDV